MGNISYRLGDKVSSGELKERLGSIKSSDNVNETLKRTIDHLAENKVKIDSDAKFQCGPHLAFDPKAYRFSGSDSKANDMLSREYCAPYVVPGAGQV